MRRRTDGFTLVEILVVLSLLGMLMGLSIGFIARAGTGNLLTETTNALAGQLAGARAQAFGSNSSYVLVERTAEGLVTIRNFRNRQVFHFPCEDLENASERGVMNASGAVEVETGGVASREGKNLLFGAGGRITLGSPPWLQYVDGFLVSCRLRPAADSTSSSLTLFAKGNRFRIWLQRNDSGGFDVRAAIQLAEGEEGRGGRVELQTGLREGVEVPEWRGPVLAGRWQDVQISYDRDAFQITVNGSVRALRTDHAERMHPDHKAEFVIGDGYEGGFDSLLIAGIFEDDEDLFEVPDAVAWIDQEGKPIDGAVYVHFRNRGLDPRHHAKSVVMTFQLDQDQRPTRTIEVGLSGESFIRRGSE
jgi:prepilin-type N-terminal cleavage/methylation domain-containing protein